MLFFNYDFNKMRIDINNSLDKISKGGKEESTGSLIDELSLNNEKTFYGQYQSAIDTVREYSDVYDNLFGKMKEVLNSFRENILKRNSDNTSVDADTNINVELESLKNSLKDILNQKHKGEYVFSGDKVLTKPFENDSFQGRGESVSLITGNYQYNTKLVNPSFLETNGVSILEDLDNVIQNPSDSNLDKIDSWLKKVGLMQVSVGVNEASVNLKSDYYTHLEITSEEMFQMKYFNLSDTIAKYQNQLIQYQAMASAFEKSSQLSLVYYV